MALLVYVTCANMVEAKRIGGVLLDKRLVACVNIMPAPVLSLYVWQGRREESQEVLLLAKTMEDRFEEARCCVRELHSYETPCITALPIVAGDSDFLDWVNTSTRPLQAS